MRIGVPGLRSDPRTRTVSRRDVVVVVVATGLLVALDRSGVLATPRPGALALGAAVAAFALERVLRAPVPWRFGVVLVPALLAWLAGADGPLRIAVGGTLAGVVAAAFGRWLQAELPHWRAALRRLESSTTLPVAVAGRRGVPDTTSLHLAAEAWLARRHPARPRRLLFSRSDWEPQLRLAFAGSPHRLAFGIDDDAVAAADWILPLALDDLERLEPFRARLAATPFPLPSPAAIALCDDKLAFNRALVAAGFGALVPALDPPPGFPYVLKRRRDAWGRHTHVVADAAQAALLAAEHADPEFFCQEAVPGAREFTTHLLLRDGRLRAALTLEFVFDAPLVVKGERGSPRYSRRVRGRHDRLFARMLGAVGFEGLCCVNYKPGADGKPRVFEVNPRFGASLAPFFPGLVRRLG